MPETTVVTGHYTHGRLVDAIRDGIEKLGKTIEEIRVDDLGPVDEFHIGGRVATEAFLDQLELTHEHQVLDVGCGLGGASRFAASRYGSRLSGVDLTPEYIETGNTLCRWVGLDDQVSLEVADATRLPHADGHFDRVYMMHVGMNIADKASLAMELHRVLKPGGKLGIYDIMKVGDGELQFPVPWATEAQGSSLSSPTDYAKALEAAGFGIIGKRSRRDFALEFFAQLQAKTAAAGGPPPLGLHILMGDTAAIKIKNLVGNIERNVVAPIELIAAKDAN